MSREAGIATWKAKKEASATVKAVLEAHIPSLSEKNEDEMHDIYVKDFDIMDFADYALRTCHCGARIDGFYEYVEHLKEEFRKVGYA